MLRRIIVVVMLLAGSLALVAPGVSAASTVAWQGQNWDVTSQPSPATTGTATPNGDGSITLTRTGGTGDVQLHVNRVEPLVGGGSFINQNGTPWVQVTYQDNGLQTGVDLFIDDETQATDQRLQVGSDFSCAGIGFSRYTQAGTQEETTFGTECNPGDRVAGSVHTVYVGERADGTLDYNFDGSWHTTTYVKDNAGQFDFNDVYLRLRKSPTSPGAATFIAFQAGDNHAGAPTLCTAVCYVDAVNGSNLNGGTSASDAKLTIQSAIDQVSPGGTVRVLPGAYSETANGRTLTSIGGTYTFGLFVGADKAGVTIQGVDAGDAPITSSAAVQATVTTNATNNFGPSGVFIEGDGVTIAGLGIGTNSAGQNKTIEVIGDAFTLKDSHVADPGGSVYINDFRFDAGSNTSHVQSYAIQGNLFDDGVSIDLASGAGFSGPVAGRQITGNTFSPNTTGDFPVISFNGADTGVPWFTDSVGGAVITGNTFGSGTQYIRARGTYDNSQFDWASYWNDNAYDRAVVVGPNPPGDVRAFSYTSGPYTFNDVRRIGGVIQAEADHALAGDTVLVKAGTYAENVQLHTDGVTLQGAGIGQTVVQGAACAGTGIAIVGSHADIAIKGLTVTGFEDGIEMFTGPLNNILIEDVAAVSNCRHGIWSQAFGINGMVFRRVDASNNDVDGTPESGRGIWIINGVKQNITIEDGTFNNNRLVGIDLSDGNVTGLTITGNTVVGNGDSGIGVLGAQGPGANLVDGNTVTDNGRFGIEIKNPTGNGAASGPGSVAVSNNVVSRTIAATDARDYAGIIVFRRSPVAGVNADQPSGVVVTNNEVSGYRRAPSGSTGDGFGIVVEGLNEAVTNNTVSDNDIGIQIQGGNPALNAQGTDYFDRGDAAQGDAAVHDNAISGNGIGLRSVGAQPAQDATSNWWGSATGPSNAGNPAGVGDSVVGDVTYSPWLCSGVDTSAATGFQPNSADVSPCGRGPITSAVVAAPATVAAGASVTLTANEDETTTGGSNIGSASYTLDGGAPVAMNAADGAYDEVAEAVTATFAAPGAGLHTLCVTGADQWGNVGDPVCVSLVVFDPNAGKVTGGGGFSSPSGAYTPDNTADPDRAGQAKLNVNSKYVPGAGVPSGAVQFTLGSANLNFTATGQDWLVVSGQSAIVRGSGTVNGAGHYAFLVSVVDGGQSDLVRVKIWNADTDAVLYDSQPGAPDDAAPTSPLGNGNLTVH